MSWQAVVQQLDFWNEGDTWGVGKVTAFSTDELNFVFNSLLAFYESSDTARTALDNLAGRGPIRIGRTSAGCFTNLTGQFVGFNPDDQVVTISTEGTVIPRLPEYNLIHEILHLFTQRDDYIDASVYAQNAEAYDFLGPQVFLENKIAREMGDIHLQDSGYLMRFAPAFAASNLGWTPNANYTDHHNIDIGRMGDIDDNTLDMRNRKDPTNDLIIGLFGNDTIYGGGGNDYIYGDYTVDLPLGGDDHLYGGDGDDKLYGGRGNDELTGGAGNDDLWGGSNGSEGGRADGADKALYGDAPAGITINLGGSTIPLMTVSDGEGGTDTLHSIEIVVGSSHADKLVLQALTAQTAAALDYIDLGGGSDTIDIAGLQGNVTVDLRNAQNQTVTFGTAVLHVHNAERVTGNNAGDVVYLPSTAATTVTGGSGDDTIYLAGSGHSISGGGGHDVLSLAGLVVGSRIQVASGTASIRGSGTSAFDGFEEVVGSDGGAFLYGDGRGTKLVGGAGVNYIEGRGADVLVGGSGDTYFAVSKGGTVISGAGNDYIDASGPDPVTIEFGVGSGHDMLGSYFQPGGRGINNDGWIASRQHDTIWLKGLTKDDIELVWDYTQVGDATPGTVPNGTYDDFYRKGEAAIRIKSTGETLYIGELFYNLSDYMARYVLYFYDYYSRNYDKGLARLASGEPSGYNQNGFYRPPNWAAYTSNDTDDDPTSVDLALFSFDGVTKLTIFDLFDLSTISSQALPPEAKAASTILARLGQGGDEQVHVGTSGPDTMTGGPGDDNLFGGDGDDVIDGGAGNDTVRAGAGNDLIVAGPGNGDYDGGSGTDTISFGWTAAGVTIDLASGTASGAEIGNASLANIENVTGGSGNDQIRGDGEANHLIGGAGNDVLAGRGGDDVLEGGAGADRLEGGAGSDTYVWRPGDGSDEIVDGAASGGYAENTLDIEGAGLADFVIRRNPVTLDGALTYTATGETILIRGMFAGGGNGVGAFDFHPAAGGVAHYQVASLALLAVDDATLGTGIYGTAADDTLAGTNGDDFIYGLDGNDVLTGLDGNDVIDGGVGADRMSGGKGNDIYFVDDAGDVVVESAFQGIDEVRTTLASYTLPANVERLTGLLSSGQTLIGNALANVLTGGSGPDVLNGGAGIDTACWAWSAAGVTVDLQTGETGGDAAGDVLISIENLTGGAGSDVLRGNAAANVLDGGSGADVMAGRGGNDTYIVDNIGDQIIELAGGGTDQVQSKLAAYALPANVENLKFLGTGDFTGTGNELGNVIEGAAGNDVLSGGDGVDTLLGRAGNDHLIGGADGDVLDGGTGADLMEGGAGNDVYVVDDTGDVVVELAGEGIDQVLTTLPFYQLPDNVENLSSNGSGNYHFIGNAAGNVIAATSGNDLLEGGAGDDELRGGSGDDVLLGGDGNDLLVGGAGKDVMTGGSGSDVFRIGGWESGVGDAADVITDFTRGEDLIDLSGIDANLWAGGRQAFTFVGSAAFSATAGELRVTFDGGDTWVQGDIDGDGVADFAILVKGDVPLSAADFML